jgi:putative sterol carrier protein
MDIDIDQIFLDMKEKVKGMDPINAKMKFVMDEHVFLIDGTGNENVVSQKDEEANSTVRTNLATFKKMKSGQLDSITALLTGKIDIDGSMGLAFKLRSLIDR